MRGDKVDYEWVVEVTDEHGDITETNAEKSYDDAKRLADTLTADGEVTIALVRDVWNDDEGLQDRQHAYLSDGVTGSLPDAFDGGAKIPARFVRVYG
jgi:hypothetical protein